MDFREYWSNVTDDIKIIYDHSDAWKGRNTPRCARKHIYNGKRIGERRKIVKRETNVCHQAKYFFFTLVTAHARIYISISKRVQYAKRSKYPGHDVAEEFTRSGWYLTSRAAKWRCAVATLLDRSITHIWRAIILEFPIVLASNDSTRTNYQSADWRRERRIRKTWERRYWDKRERFHS